MGDKRLARSLISLVIWRWQISLAHAQICLADVSVRHPLAPALMCAPAAQPLTRRARGRAAVPIVRSLRRRRA